MYASDIGTVFPGTNLAQVVEDAHLTPEKAGEWAADALEADASLREQISLEDLTTILTEAGERSLNLANLVRGEISTLMKVKKEITYNSPQKEWTVSLPSGSITFGEMEDFCVEIMEAKLNS